MNNKWSSTRGFILASAGAAIGLGNLWKFPYLMGENGGFGFLLFYAIFVVTLGLPIMIAEMSIGRYTGKENVGAYKSLGKGGIIIGIIGAISSFLILSYYGVVGGWIIKYIVEFSINNISSIAFDSYVQYSLEPIAYMLLFLIVTATLCIKGTKSIETASSVMMPLLAVILIIIAVIGFFLPNSIQGYRFMFFPTKGISSSVVIAALGQVFYSMSLCMGVNVTYGSYLGKKENIPNSSVIIALADSLIAVTAGLAIFPAVFSYGFEPTTGTGLTFGVLPTVFNNMLFGKYIGIAFFVLMLFAALTSSISLLESVSAVFMDKFNFSRGRALLLILLCSAILGSLCSLSFGILSDIKIAERSIFDAVNLFADNILMPINGILLAIYVGWIWKPEFIKEHIGYGYRFLNAWAACIKYITPILVGLVLINSFFNI